jgi:hypothetical protein
MLLEGAGAFVELPSLSCGAISDAAIVVVDEEDSVRGQVLLIGGSGHDGALTSSIQLVALATGVCTPQADLLHARCCYAAARLPDGRIVCAGGELPATAAEILGPPVQGAMDAAWFRRELPPMSVVRLGCGGCVLSDGRFAVLGGVSNYVGTSSCEALSFGADEHWTPLQPMHETRAHFACAAVAECIIVAGGWHRTSAEVYDEALGRWLRLPCNLPHNIGYCDMGSALV